MERRRVLLNTLGGASMALLAWPPSPGRTDARAKRSPHLDDLMAEVRAICAWAGRGSISDTLSLTLTAPGLSFLAMLRTVYGS